MLSTYEIVNCGTMFSKENTLEFSEWLVNEMRKRDWSQAELARKSGLTRGGISNLINRVRKPNADTCNALARALGYPPDYVMRQAGLLPRKEATDSDPRLKIIVHLVGQLDPDDQEEVIAFIETKRRLGEQRGKYNATRPYPTSVDLSK